MSVTVPTKQTSHLRRDLSKGDRSYSRLVIRPAQRFFWLAMTAYVGIAIPLLFVALDALEWLGVLTAPLTATQRILVGGLALAVAIAALESRRYGRELHKLYLETPDTTVETKTEERAVVTEHEQRHSMTAPPTDSPRNFQVGKFGFTKPQLRKLAAHVANGGSFSHNALMKAGIITDRTNPDDAQYARDIQADLVRLGYAYRQGKATVPSTAGLMYFAQYAPTPELAELLSRGQTTNHNQPQPTDNDERGVA